jgi:Dolichyl-phosphate-mannose-protein mannosyltransferase
LAHRADALSRNATPRPSDPIAIRFVPVLVVIAAVEIAWMHWVLTVPLPNAANAGGLVTRSFFLWRALPFVVPGLSFAESNLGLAIAQLRHVENLSQRLPILLAGALIAAAAVSLGSLALRALRCRGDFSNVERIPLAFGLGASGLGVFTLIMGRLGWIGPWRVRGALVAFIIVELACRWRNPPPKPKAKAPSARRGPLIVLGLVVTPFLTLMALGSMLPTIDFDCLEYHLQGPKEYYESGRISFLPHNVYTSMPFGVEMLHLLGMEVLGDWWRGSFVGQFLVMLHAPAAAALIALAARDWGSARAAWFAAVVYLSTPWIFRLAAIPYVEGPLCYYHAALIWMAGRAWRSASWKTLGLLGALAGGAMTCKYPGLISAVVPFGLLSLVAAWRRRSWSIVLAFAAGVAVVIGPWLIKNVIDTGNPVYPLGYRVFGGRDWTPQREAKWNAVHGPRGLSWNELGSGVIEVAGRSDWQSPLYSALVPLAFLRAPSRRYALILLGYVMYLFATWWLLTHRLDRFWLPLLPAAAILAGLGADWTRRAGWLIILAPLVFLSLLANLAYCTTALVGLNQWTDDYAKLRVEVPKFTNPPLAFLDAELPQGAKVLLVGQASVFHTRHAIVYNTVFNEETIEQLVYGRSSDQVLGALTKLGVTHVYVDWFEIERYRQPGNYGFTPFVTPQVFHDLVRERVLESPIAIGSRQELFRVRRPPAGAQ